MKSLSSAQSPWHFASPAVMFLSQRAGRSLAQSLRKMLQRNDLTSGSSACHLQAPKAVLETVWKQEIAILGFLKWWYSDTVRVMKGSRDSELHGTSWDWSHREKSPVNVTQVHKSNLLCCAAVGSTDSRRRDAHGALSRQGYLFCSA